MKLSGWGRYPIVDADLVAPLCNSQVMDHVCAGATDAMIPRGLGRSYGDSSLSSNVLSTQHIDHFLDFDQATGLLSCAAGVSLATILDIFVPRGWFLPVTPGTKYVTVGGAIASDVHGKNHHLDGSFSDHVVAMKVATLTEGVVSCSPELNADLFHATAGGMGLTGIILEATFSLKLIESALVNETRIKARNLEEALDLFEQYQSSTYSVAWIDCLSSGRSLGRSILSLGEHARDGELRPAKGSRMAVPVDMPGVLLNPYSIKAFNALYYHRVRSPRQDRRCHYDAYFYPLDGIANWNRMYGKKGFVQYQFVLPVEAGLEGMKAVLTRISASKMGSFLSVLKAFGDGNRNYLSFPAKGYTLALDFKMSRGLFSLLDELDAIVLACGGRLYLTKDARMSATTFRQCYPDWEHFIGVRKKYGADKLFHSGQSRRLEL